MQKEEIYSEIISTIHTKEDVDTLVREIDHLTSALYKDNGNALVEMLGKKVRQKVAKLFEQAFANPEINKDEFLKDLSGRLSKLEFIKLTIAFEPTPKGIERITNWVRSNLGENIVLDLDIDKSQIAGAIISFKGEYVDLSARKKFETLFKQEQIANNLLNVT